jgi:hypothetical protein
VPGNVARGHVIVLKPAPLSEAARERKGEFCIVGDLAWQQSKWTASNQVTHTVGKRVSDRFAAPELHGCAKGISRCLAHKSTLRTE